MSESLRTKPHLQRAFIASSFFLLAFYWLVVATYPQFFIFNPFDDGWGLRQGTLILSLLGWVTISTVPAAILVSYALGFRSGIKWLPLAALIWPASVVINQILLYIRDSVWYFDYLINFPVFIATDILLPGLLLVLWWELKEIHGDHAAD